MPSPLTHADLDALAQAENLLVISDFDGTLAGFSTEPMNVPVNESGVQALGRLATLPGTTAGILSGRSLEQLDVVCPLRSPVLRVGSHGAEPEGAPILLNDAQRAALDAADAELTQIAARAEGSFVERKPFQRVLHTRAVGDRALAADMANAALTAGAQIPGIGVHEGKAVIELSVATATKGSWLREFMAATTPDATLFLGDDTTDETAFAVLAEPNIGVKVGHAETAANRTVAGISEVGHALEYLAEARFNATRV